MFEDITPAMLARMKALEAQDLRDRTDGTPHGRRLRQVPPDAGRFIALLAASTPPGPWLEIGTSAGYSTLWLALAARATGRKVITFDLDPAKCALARQTFELCGVNDVVTLVEGDALAEIPKYDGIAFCFLDAEKKLYDPCFDLVIPRMIRGGLLVGDNAISHAADLAGWLARVQSDPRVDSVLVPIGTGDMLCRRK